MKNSKTTRKALFASALSLVLTTSMMIGTTWAWFTDSATSTNNKIQAGTLNIDLEKKVGDEWKSVKDNPGPVFNYDRWEPGYTNWTNVRVKTTGNLALKYTLKFIGEEAANSELADVIDVYYASSNVDKPDTRDLSGLTNIGTLKDVFAGTVEIDDDLTPAEAATAAKPENTEDYATIALKMRESAGNEYQGKTIPAFDLSVVATQNTVEEDDFDDQYDANATFPIVVSNKSQLESAINNATDGETIRVSENISGDINVDSEKKVNIDLDGNTLTGTLLVKDGEVTINNGTIAKTSGQGLMITPNDGANPKIVIGKDVTVKGHWGITLFNETSSDSANVSVDMYGKVEGNIFVSGNLKSGNSVINVYGEVDGGTDANTIGIAVNGAATVNVKNGAVVKGGTGIEVRAGELVVEPGTTITGTATPTNVSPNGSGTTTQGAGIGVSQHTTKLPINVVINGGTISGHTPLYEANPQNNSDEDLAKINIAVNGGTFTCINGGTNKFSIADEDKITYTNSVQ